MAELDECQTTGDLRNIIPTGPILHAERQVLVLDDAALLTRSFWDSSHLAFSRILAALNILIRRNWPVGMERSDILL